MGKNARKDVNNAPALAKTASAALMSADSVSKHASDLFSSKLCVRADAFCTALLSRTPPRRASHVQPAWSASRAIKVARSVITFRMKKGLAVGKS